MPAKKEGAGLMADEIGKCKEKLPQGGRPLKAGKMADQIDDVKARMGKHAGNKSYDPRME